jgi:riboflavin kinase/FMN adenylyltransferase
MDYPENKVAVKEGVYHIECDIDGTTYHGIANYGPRPTFEESEPQLEAFFDGFEGDLYGRELTITFIDYLRDIQTFDSPEALTEQLKTDLEKVRACYD